MSPISTEPFWQDLRRQLPYPLRPASLVVMGVLSLGHAADFVPVVGIVLQLVVWIALYRYAFDCLRSSADGQTGPPRAQFVLDDSSGWALVWLQTIFFTANLIGFLGFGLIGGIPVAIALSLALPGAIMTLAIDESLAQALNPAAWRAIFVRIGRPYIVIATLQFLFNVLTRYAGSVSIPTVPPLVTLVGLYFVAHYLVVLSFHLMGQLIWQNHEALGHEPESVRALRRANAGPDDEVLEEVEELVRDGDPQVARELIAHHLLSNVGSEVLHIEYRKLLALSGQLESQLSHGRDWIGTLLAQGNDRRAADVARECLTLDPAFELSSPDQVARVAAKAAAENWTAVALKLVSGFHRRYPKHRDIPRNYLLAARLLADRMGKVGEARALLDQLRRGYPDHPLAADIATYRSTLDTAETSTTRVAG
ncbi:MAG: hypothetical protein ABIR62_13525 [Dokdonella sp.]|uniref:tetratricopeptide repeat protein n=1 Tax=Dokdonella sp. TaxID=2291710 RepID=UPI003263B9A5